MAGICFFFESSDVDVWSGKNLDAWNYAMKCAGDIDKMIVINRTPQHVQSPDTDVQCTVVNELPILSNAVYFVGPNEQTETTISLWQFDHNVEWYCFGPAGGWKMINCRTVTIPQAGRGALHAVHVASVVMFHRYAKMRALWPQ